MTSPAARLSSLLTYLGELEALKHGPALSVPAEPFRAFQADIGGLPGLTFDQLHDGEDIWLSLPRLGPIPPPEPSASLEPWIDLTSSTDAEPTLRGEVLRPGKMGDTRLTRAGFPGISKVFETYLAEEWQPWAEAERPRRQAIALYNQLFALRQLLVTGASDAPLELVWGMGMALWKPPGARQALRYPLIAQACEIALNAVTFELEIRPRDAGATLELEGVAVLQGSAARALGARWLAHLAAAANRPSPFDGATTAPFLKSAAKLLDPAGQFLGGTVTARLPDPAPQLLLSDTWVLFARRRSVRGVLKDAADFKARLEPLPALEPAVAPLVTARAPPATGEGGAAEPLKAAAGESRTDSGVFFPLAHSDAQASIIARLASEPVVIVEGPPGTGKTQTIANVICHYLALGKRVLVTASDDSALAGLRNLLPEDVRPLAVALVSSDRSVARQFLHAAQGFASRAGSAKVRELEAAVAANDRRAADLRAAITAVDARIADLAHHQLSPLSVAGREVTAAELAQRVVDGSARHGWLTDALDPGSQATPAFSATDVSELRDARITLGPDLAYLGVTLPEAASLPDEAALLALHHELIRAHRTEALNAAGSVLPLVDRSPQTLERAAKLRDLLDKADALHAAVDKDPFGWADRLRVRFQAREDPLARGLVTVARSVAVEDLAQRVRMSRSVDLPASIERSPEVVEAIERLADGKLAFLVPLGNKAARASLDAITVAGAKPANAADWRRVADELEHRAKTRKLVAAWNTVVRDCNLEPLRESGAGAFRSLAAHADHVLKMHELVTRVEAPIRAEIPAVFAPGALEDLSEHDGSLGHAAAESLASHLDDGQTAGASSRVREVLVKLEGASGAIVDRLWAFLTTTLGRRAGDAALAAEWGALLLELRRLAALAPLLATVERVAGAIESSGGRRWAVNLRRTPATGTDDAFTPPDWPEAWQWRIVAMRLGSLEGHDTLKQLAQRRASAAADLERAMRTLAVDRAWLAVLRSSSAELRRALHDYALAARALQARGGARARVARTEASTARARAAAVLPCLIVPQWRIAEILPAEPATFDLVVVDEASRSDLGAIPALLRGRQLLILGDPMLAPPPAATVARQKLQELGRRLLAGQPYGAEMAPGRSLYDLACVAYAAVPVPLREQFRSDAAIAEFSSREFYGHSLRSLRTPAAAERLDPPLLDVQVEGAERNGNVNDAEAHAIARHVEAMLADPALAGRSLGVVSLLGPEQALRIEELIRARISPRDIIARRIVVGTPVRFQGRGRSVMLLSMVLTADSPGVGDARAIAQQFNVAVTSARDRLVLFRSVGEADLPPDSCHARLLRHFRAPFGAAPDGSAEPRALCRSDLERAIFDALVTRNYRVRPRFEVGASGIDLVVEGGDDRRLAVQCDGDEGHAPQQWAADMAAQRRLERLGWTVWRCFAASFILRREHVLEDLFGTLEQLGIEPLGAAPPAPVRPSAHSVVGTPRLPAAQVAAPLPETEPAAEPAAEPAPARASRRSRPQR